MAKINIFALGGLDEKAKNMYVLEIDSKMYIIDAGINEPVRDDFGVQQIIPKLDYLKLNSDKIKGIFLSTPAKYQLGAI
ncbi:MAG: hypothetical protein DRP42_01745 [Tenericutes bacterium]|nr:MAG: hypothetical protein DRP42_01745 [Mycoplasmatota bacterium]